MAGGAPVEAVEVVDLAAGAALGCTALVALHEESDNATYLRDHAYYEALLFDLVGLNSVRIG